MKILSTFVVCLVFQSASSFAVPVAKADLDWWPTKVASRAEWDKVSRAELLLLVEAYINLFAKVPSAESLGVKSVHADSLSRWQKKIEGVLVANFKKALTSCKTPQELACAIKANSFRELSDGAKGFDWSKYPELSRWLEFSREFYRAYVSELARLAALFPKPTSEILPVAKNEFDGSEFADGQFVLTFDDGPTNGKTLTDDYVQLLNKHKIRAGFFVLGESLQTRIQKSKPEKVRELYAQHCLWSHGYVHKAHPTYDAWESSLAKTDQLITTVKSNAKVFFRPPYGQRHEELMKYLERGNNKAVLWNIDSQDWHSKMTDADVLGRVAKLMYVWRKGIILFHDVHSKGLKAIPGLVDVVKAGGLELMDCRTLEG